MKRQRGRGRKPGGGHNFHNQPNRTMESNGPDAKVRGPAAHIYERYLQLARDAASSGDRVLSENYLQHADHYFRVLRQMQPSVPVQPVTDRFAGEAEEEGAEEEARAAEPGARAEQGGEVESEAAQGDGQQPQERGEGDFRRGRRGRRSRFRPGAEGGEGSGGGEAREGGASGERRERPQREGGERDQGGGEGFSYGPKPAFLGSD